MSAPLDGVLVVDFSQFLAGPLAALRLQDLGARVIKVENPDGGDLCRRLYLSDTRVSGESTLFHAINRGKESVALDLKSEAGLAEARALVARADVMIQNFRPGVIERLGFGYDAVRELNPKIVYGSISGYGDEGEWADLPGQDLLAQARSGIMWLSGNADAGPVPVGLPVADIFAGVNLATALLGALVRQARKGQGGHVSTSLLESLADVQFELLTTYLNNGRKHPERLQKGSAHGYLGAPYGVFETRDGALALAMTSLAKLSEVLDLPELAGFAGIDNAAFGHRTEIHELLSGALHEKSASAWEAALAPYDIWCARVLDWDDLLASKSFAALGLTSEVTTERGETMQMMRAPFRIDGARPEVTAAGPRLGAHQIKD